MSYQKQSKPFIMIQETKLRRGVFTIFVDENVDKNSSSVTAAGHFHGAGVTVLQFLSEENPGVQYK